VDTEEIEGGEDKVEDAVPTIKHSSRIEPDNARWVTIVVWKYG